MPKLGWCLSLIHANDKLKLNKKGKTFVSNDVRSHTNRFRAQIRLGVSLFWPLLDLHLYTRSIGRKAIAQELCSLWPNFDSPDPSSRCFRFGYFWLLGGVAISWLTCFVWELWLISTWKKTGQLSYEQKKNLFSSKKRPKSAMQLSQRATICPCSNCLWWTLQPSPPLYSLEFRPTLALSQR